MNSILTIAGVIFTLVIAGNLEMLDHSQDLEKDLQNSIDLDYLFN
jgi:capsular polysaccharide biosynthesis protein|tara:strand:- start:3441 stop:3575 length:135 start_codon:yes stop_codon:yes gene_type:complete